MSTQQQMFAVIASLVGQRNILTIPRVFIDLVDGDLHAALLLSQCVYWSDKGSRQEFYKSDAEWREELGLTDYRLRQAKKTLVDKGFITTQVRRANGAPTTHYRLQQEQITGAITRFVEGHQVDLLTVNETDSVTVTETITETTSETTTKATGAATPPPAAPAKPPDLPDLDTPITGHAAMKNVLLAALRVAPQDVTCWGEYERASKLLRGRGATRREVEGAARWCARHFTQFGPMAVAKHLADYRTEQAQTYANGLTHAEADVLAAEVAAEYAQIDANALAAFERIKGGGA